LEYQEACSIFMLQASFFVAALKCSFAELMFEFVVHLIDKGENFGHRLIQLHRYLCA